MAEEARWTLGRKSMVGCLFVFIAWGSILVMKDNPSAPTADMFSSCVWGLIGTLVNLVGGKAIKSFVELKGKPSVVDQGH